MHVLCKCQSRRFKHLFTKRRRYPRIDLSTVDDGYKVHDLRTSYIGKNWNRKHLFSVLFKQMIFRALTLRSEKERKTKHFSDYFVVASYCEHIMLSASSELKLCSLISYLRTQRTFQLDSVCRGWYLVTFPVCGHWPDRQPIW